MGLAAEAAAGRWSWQEFSPFGGLVVEQLRVVEHDAVEHPLELLASIRCERWGRSGAGAVRLAAEDEQAGLAPCDARRMCHGCGSQRLSDVPGSV